MQKRRICVRSLQRVATPRKEKDREQDIPSNSPTHTNTHDTGEENFSEAMPVGSRLRFKRRSWTHYSQLVRGPPRDGGEGQGRSRRARECAGQNGTRWDERAASEWRGGKGGEGQVRERERGCYAAMLLQIEHFFLIFRVAQTFFLLYTQGI